MKSAYKEKGHSVSGFWGKPAQLARFGRGPSVDSPLKRAGSDDSGLDNSADDSDFFVRTLTPDEINTLYHEALNSGKVLDEQLAIQRKWNWQLVFDPETAFAPGGDKFDIETPLFNKPVAAGNGQPPTFADLLVEPDSGVPFRHCNLALPYLVYQDCHPSFPPSSKRQSSISPNFLLQRAHPTIQRSSL